MNRKAFIISLLTATLGIIGQCYAGSIYSRHGIGLLQYRDGTKAMGLGGLSMALSDSVSIFFLNPAVLSSISLTHLQGEFIYDWASVELANNTGEFQDANVGGLDLIFPVRRGYALALGVHPYSRADFVFQGSGSLPESDYAETVTGSGGLENIYIALAGSAGKLRWGAALDFYVGVLEQNWRVRYTSSEFRETDDFRTIKMRGLGAHGGIHATLGAFELGAALGLPVNVKTESRLQIRPSAESVGEVLNGTTKLPVWYGGSAVFHPNRKTLLGLQLRTQPWNSVSADELLGAQGSRSHNLGFGAEFIPSLNPLDGFFSKMNFRLGATHSRLPYKDIQDSNIDEYTVTAGLGLPFNRGFSRIDFAVEYGKRGISDNHPAKETIFRFSASVNGSERWFQRRK